MEQVRSTGKYAALTQPGTLLLLDLKRFELLTYQLILEHNVLR